jgi:hypothetical protein
LVGWKTHFAFITSGIGKHFVQILHVGNPTLSQYFLAFSNIQAFGKSYSDLAHDFKVGQRFADRNENITKKLQK